MTTPTDPINEMKHRLQDRVDEKQLRLQARFEEKQARIQERLEFEQIRLRERLSREQEHIEERILQHQQRLLRGLGVTDEDKRPGRERILEHARALFLERGYLDVSMREIAEAAGLRKASIYHHFRDKEELFTAIVISETTALRHRMEQSIEGATGFRERLERVTLTHLKSTRSHSMRLAEDYRAHVPESRHEEMHAELGRLFSVYQTVFTEAHTAGELTNIEPSLAASCFFQIVISLAWDWMDIGGPVKPEPEELADLAVRIMLFGVAGPAIRAESGA